MSNAPLVVLVLAGVGFAAFGAWLLLDPSGGLGRVGIAATTPAGLIEMRRLRKPGCIRGIVLISTQSLIDYVSALPTVGSRSPQPSP